MKRCVDCNRAVDDTSGIVVYEKCPWCNGVLSDDPVGPQTIADALQVLWTVNHEIVYKGCAAEADLRDLCPGLPEVIHDIKVADELGVLKLIQSNKLEAAHRALVKKAHWNEAMATELVLAYKQLDPSYVASEESIDSTDTHSTKVEDSAVGVAHTSGGQSASNTSTSHGVPLHPRAGTVPSGVSLYPSAGTVPSGVPLHPSRIR